MEVTLGGTCAFGEGLHKCPMLGVRMGWHLPAGG